MEIEELQFDRESCESRSFSFPKSLPAKDRILELYMEYESSLLDAPEEYLPGTSNEAFVGYLRWYRKTNRLTLTWGWFVELCLSSSTESEIGILRILQEVWGDQRFEEHDELQLAVGYFVNLLDEKRFASRLLNTIFDTHIPVMLQEMKQCKWIGPKLVDLLITSYVKSKEMTILEGILESWFWRFKGMEIANNLVMTCLKKRVLLEEQEGHRIKQWRSKGFYFWKEYTKGNEDWEKAYVMALIQVPLDKGVMKFLGKHRDLYEDLVERGYNLVEEVLYYGTVPETAYLMELIHIQGSRPKVDLNMVNMHILGYLLSKGLRGDSLLKDYAIEVFEYVVPIIRVLYKYCQIEDKKECGLNTQYQVALIMAAKIEELMELLGLGAFQKEDIPYLIHMTLLAGGKEKVPYLIQARYQ